MGDFLKQLPALYKGGENAKLLEAIEKHRAEIEKRIDGLRYYFDPDRCPPEQLDKLLRLKGWNLQLDLTERQKRRLVKMVTTIQDLSGTTRGMINALRYLLGVEVEFREYLKIRWESEQTAFDENDISNYAFDVVFPLTARDDDVALSKQLIEYMMTGNTHYTPIQLLEIQNDKTHQHSVTMNVNKRFTQNKYDPQGYELDDAAELKMDGTWRMDGSLYLYGKKTLPPERKSEARHSVGITIYNASGQVIRSGPL